MRDVPKKWGIAVSRHAEFDFDTFSERREDPRRPEAKDVIFRAFRPAGRPAGHTFPEGIVMGNLRLQ